VCHAATGKEGLFLFFFKKLKFFKKNKNKPPPFRRSVAHLKRDFTPFHVCLVVRRQQCAKKGPLSIKGFLGRF
jgi:hypothetical protein